MERRQLCLVFIDEVKQVGFKARFKCGEEGSFGLCLCCEVIPGICRSIADHIATSCSDEDCVE